MATAKNSKTEEQPYNTPDKITALTPEQEKEVEVYREKWNKNAMRTDPMTDEEREKCRVAVGEMYDIAKQPRPDHVVFVKSPRVMAFAGGFAAALHFFRTLPREPDAKQPNEQDLWRRLAEMLDTAGKADRAGMTSRLLDAATTEYVVLPDDPEDVVTSNEVKRALRKAIEVAVEEEPKEQIESLAEQIRTATLSASGLDPLTYFNSIPTVEDKPPTLKKDDAERQVSAALAKVKGDESRNALIDLVVTLGKQLGAKSTHEQVTAAIKEQTAFMLECSRQYYNLWNGGNQWSGWCAMLDYWVTEHRVRVDGVNVFEPYRVMAECSGPRLVHDKYVMISDRPTALHLIDTTPHCTTGPAYAWSDGWQLWYIDGFPVDEQIVMRPETQTIQQINGEENADIKAIRISRYGWPRYLKDINAKCLEEGPNDVDGTYEVLYECDNESNRFIAVCPTGRIFTMGVPPTVRTRAEAQKYLAGDNAFRSLGRT